MANPKNKLRDAGDEQTAKDVNHICGCGDAGWQVKPNTVKLCNTALHICTFVHIKKKKKVVSNFKSLQIHLKKTQLSL